MRPYLLSWTMMKRLCARSGRSEASAAAIRALGADHRAQHEVQRRQKRLWLRSLHLTPFLVMTPLPQSSSVHFGNNKLRLANERRYFYCESLRGTI